MQPLLEKKGREDFFWLSLLVLIYLFFWTPVVGVHPPLSSDHGRDFYAFWMTFQGKRPCWDFWWQYGPLMPLYYAFWFLGGGVNLMSVRIGLAFNYFFCSFSAYLTLRHFTSGFIAFVSSLAFLSFNMTWTYNHVGSIPFLLLSISCLWKFFLTHKSRWCYGAFLSLAGVTLVKINVGVSSFIALYTLLLIYNGFFLWKHLKMPLRARHLVFLPLLFGALTLGIYGVLYSGLSLNQIGSCLTLGPRYHQRSSFTTNFKHLILYFLVWQPTRLWGVGIFLLLSILAVIGLKKRSLEKEAVTLFSFVVISLVLVGLATTAEYFVIHSIIHRFDFWLFPVLVLLMGLFAQWGSFVLPTKMKFFLGGLLLFPLLGFPYLNFKDQLTWRRPGSFLAVPNGRVDIGGPLSDLEVLQRGSQFISNHTRPDETILVIPYEPLYCFLSGRHHAVPEQNFTQVIPLPEGREEGIIQELEVKQVPYVILSNLYYSKEAGVGRFGETHCRKLAKYIFEHYQETQTFGPWDPPSVSSLNAVKIFQRKNPA